MFIVPPPTSTHLCRLCLLMFNCCKSTPLLIVAQRDTMRFYMPFVLFCVFQEHFNPKGSVE